MAPAIVSFNALHNISASNCIHGGKAILPILFFKIILKTNLERLVALLALSRIYLRRYDTLGKAVTPSPLQTASMPILFFKIVLKTNLERLKLPNKFTSNYVGALPNPVFMKPPDGTQWKVYWAKQNGEVWFEKGWKQFVEHYSLDEGHFIFFNYEGTSQIDVLILDQSALEIEYPSCDEKENPDNSDEESVTILDEWPDQKTKQMRGEKPTERTSSLNWPTQTRAQEVARNFISDNPFFTVFLKPVHVAESRLSTPDLKGIIESKEKYVMLQLGERSWSVKWHPSYNSFSYGRLCAGWSSFARENELQPGDVCVFELISREDSVFKVHVFKRHN